MGARVCSQCGAVVGFWKASCPCLDCRQKRRCEHCGKEFISSRNRRFCTLSCSSKSHPLTGTALWEHDDFVAAGKKGAPKRAVKSAQRKAQGRRDRMSQPDVYGPMEMSPKELSRERGDLARHLKRERHCLICGGVFRTQPNRTSSKAPSTYCSEQCERHSRVFRSQYGDLKGLPSGFISAWLAVRELNQEINRRTQWPIPQTLHPAPTLIPSQA